jgi:hypothetical protein
VTKRPQINRPTKTLPSGKKIGKGVKRGGRRKFG